MMKEDLYNFDYFENGLESKTSLYVNYRWLPELTIPFCFRLIEVLSIRESDLVLDFGCAKGFMVKALRLLYRNVYGVDISKYAIENSPADITSYVKHINSVDEIDGHYDLIIAKDVFEHISFEEIGYTLRSLRGVSDKLFCIIPLGNGKTFNFREYELDTTHRIRQTHRWWIDSFEKTGFRLNFFEFYIKGMKENCTHGKGNGFFYFR